MRLHIPILYLDTSVIGGYFDEEYKEATQELWRQMEQGLFRFAASIITSQELDAAPECVRDLFVRTFTRSGMIFDVTAEMDDLAAANMQQAVVPARYTDDARHVAVCVVEKADYRAYCEPTGTDLWQPRRKTLMPSQSLANGVKPLTVNSTR